MVRGENNFNNILPILWVIPNKAVLFAQGHLLGQWYSFHSPTCLQCTHKSALGGWGRPQNRLGAHEERERKSHCSGENACANRRAALDPPACRKGFLAPSHRNPYCSGVPKQQWKQQYPCCLSTDFPTLVTSRCFELHSFHHRWPLAILARSGDLIREGCSHECIEAGAKSSTTILLSLPFQELSLEHLKEAGITHVTLYWKQSKHTSWKIIGEREFIDHS